MDIWSVEDSSLLGCDTMPLGKQYRTFYSSVCLITLKDGGNTLFLNVWYRLPNGMVSHLRKLESSAPVLWEPQVLFDLYITSAFLIFFSDIVCSLRVKLHLHLHGVIFISAPDCTVLCITETGRYLLYLFHAQKVISHYSLLMHLTVDIVHSMCLVPLTDVQLLQLRTTALCCNPSFLRLLTYCFAMNKSNVHCCSFLSCT